MALQLQTTLDNGFTADYYRIDKIEISFADTKPTTIISLGLYKSKQNRNNGSTPVNTSYLIFNKSIETRAEGYTTLKLPVLETVIDTPAIVDIDGNITTPAITHTVDTNIFSQSVDV
jgi:hypothetical protein